MAYENLGDYLKSKREELSFSLDDIVAETKIQKMYIIAMEEENYKELPEPIYVKGFLKTYARALKIDEKEVVDLYQVILDESNKKEEVFTEDVKPRKVQFFLILLLIIIAIAFGSFKLYSIIVKNYENKKIENIDEDKPKIVLNKDGVYVETADLKLITIIASGKAWITIKDEKNRDNDYRGYIYPEQKIIIKTKNKLIIESDNGYNIKINIDGNEFVRLSENQGEYIRKEF